MVRRFSSPNLALEAGPLRAIPGLLRVATGLTRFPLALFYRLRDERAELLGHRGPEEITSILATDVPRWRVARDEVVLAPLIGHGPAMPESALLPARRPPLAMISAPAWVDGRPLGTLVLADWEHRPDLETLDRAALATLCELLGQTLRPSAPTPAPALSSSTRRADPTPTSVRHDPITGLPDRSMLVNALHEALEQARPSGDAVVVAILALDRFQRIDDWLGRKVGDELLRQVAERVLETTRDQDLVARAGDDEIIIAFTGLRRATQASALADRTIQSLRQPFHALGYDLSLSATGGLAAFPDDAQDVATLLRYAGIALHRAKERGRGRFWAFDPAMREAVEQRGQLERDLRDGLSSGELVFHYQPKVRLPSKRFFGVEALVRWKRSGKMVSPGQFIPVAEESGLIVPLGTLCLHVSCRQMRRWLDAGVPIETMAVNVSALQFSRPDFVGTIERTLESAGLAPRHLEIEVTESLLMADIQGASERLGALRELGVRVAIDDFGTGYSSLAYLQRLPIDVLKIDRAFVKDLDAGGETARHARVLAQTIAGLGHGLGLEVIAEGIETPAQLEIVEALDCEGAQGFYFARPLPAEEIPATLQRTG